MPAARQDRFLRPAGIIARGLVGRIGRRRPQAGLAAGGIDAVERALVEIAAGLQGEIAGAGADHAERRRVGLCRGRGRENRAGRPGSGCRPPGFAAVAGEASAPPFSTDLGVSASVSAAWILAPATRLKSQESEPAGSMAASG